MVKSGDVLERRVNAETISLDDFVEMVERKQKDPYAIRNPDNFTYSKNIDGYRFTDADFC
jgi:hypothetical protein